ncbi:TPA: restriction endonuclease subunit S [Enterobacter bugandensis]|uniref:restriction endonuclease subunit S n=1 Tax=Enterobacter bugandensis TaxID=881260 RepID=UPI001F42F76B|nr:restriction endonuclease subunit S [Enterobacter bugandensis]HDX4394108.1 restriction endonuclease subunit S [Enterobacter bugandensis]
MSVDKKVPKIRFKGFSDEWKTSQLSELALFNPKSELPESFKYVDLECVKGTSLTGYQVESRDSAPSRAQRLAKKGDVFYQTVRPYQKNNYLFHGVENEYVFSTGYAQLRPYFNGNFLLNLIQRDLFVKDVLNNCTGTSYPAINASTLATLGVSYSESEVEQTQIGNYFQKLDMLINQHEQKHNKLSSIKKAMLEKMFPKPGEIVPEIRFKGFSGEWVHITIGDCSTLITKGTTPMTIGKTFVDRGITFVKVECIDEIGNLNPAKFAYIDNETDQALARSRIKENDLLVSIAGALGRAAIVKKEILPANTNQALAIVRLKNDSPIVINFLYHFTKSRDFKEFVDETASQGAQPNLSLGDISKLRILAPKKEEQTAIGNYFHKLDALINQHQQQITKLINIKQACLSKMFV